MSSVERYEHLDRRLVCKNQRFEVFFDSVRVADAVTIADFLVVRPRVHAEGKVAGVCILPEVEGKIGLMRTYRHQLGEEVWQAPAGFIEPGETAEATALRELHEETALVCDPLQVQALGTYLPDPGLIEGRVALFVGRECIMNGQCASFSTEVGTGCLHFFDYKELLDLLLSNSQLGGSTLVACFRYLLRKAAI